MFFRDSLLVFFLFARLFVLSGSGKQLERTQIVFYQQALPLDLLSDACNMSAEFLKNRGSEFRHSWKESIIIPTH